MIRILILTVLLVVATQCFTVGEHSGRQGVETGRRSKRQTLVGPNFQNDDVSIKDLLEFIAHKTKGYFNFSWIIKSLPRIDNIQIWNWDETKKKFVQIFMISSKVNEADSTSTDYS